MELNKTDSLRQRATAIECGMVKHLMALVFVAIALCGCQTLPPNTLATHNPGKWAKEVAAFEAEDGTNLPPSDCIVFTGSSSIRLWKSLTNDFAGLPVVNRGFGGCQIADVVHYSPRVVTKYKPRQVVVYAGGNDLNAGKDPDLVYGDFVALVHALRDALPGVKLAYISSAPNIARWKQVENVKRLNSLVQSFCEKNGVQFINVYPLMLGPDGTPRPDIFVKDNLHMNEKGYAIWRAEVERYLLANPRG